MGKIAGVSEIKRNSLHHGDCYDLIKKIPDNSVDLIYTDIPYEFDSGGNAGAFGIKMKMYNRNILVSDGKKKEKEKNKKDFEGGVDWDILDEFVRVMKDIWIFIWCSKKQIPYLIDYFVNERGCMFDILVWCKTNAIPKTNNMFLPDAEYCLFFRGGGEQTP